MTTVRGRSFGPPIETSSSDASRAEVPGGRKRTAATDGLDAALRGGDAARPRAQTNAKVKGVMANVKRAGIAAAAVAILLGGAFVAKDRFIDPPGPPPAPVVVPIEQPDIEEGPGLPGVPVDVKPLEEAPVDSSGGGGGPPGLPSGGPQLGDPGGGAATGEDGPVSLPRGAPQLDANPGPEVPRTFRPWERPNLVPPRNGDGGGS